MANQALKLECDACDHELVHGVACDGQYEECPYLMRKVARATRGVPHPYLFEVAGLAQPGEFDAVRSDS
jgi:hypothetical protein